MLRNLWSILCREEMLIYIIAVATTFIGALDMPISIFMVVMSFEVV